MNAPTKIAQVELQDKYSLDEGRLYLTGSQALVRLLLVQRRIDVAAGLNTAGFISGYRGSPMTAIDNELWRAGSGLLEEHHIHFWPGLNENLAMTSLWGSQQVGYFNDANYDGVFSMWYGKGPGLDQTIDGLRQANLHGTGKHGGALILVGDDPEMRSTVNPYHSELLFEDLLMPVLYPADIQDVFDMGIYGIAMSRFCGAYVGYKLLPETIETASSIDGSYERIKPIIPDFAFPPDGPNSRYGDNWVPQEGRQRNYKLPAALAFARANKLNRVTLEADTQRFGIAAMGKTWRDVQQALIDLGITVEDAKRLGINILKVAMPFPSDDQLYREFGEGMEEVLVVEDKREQIENGFKRACYDLPKSKRPRIVGRHDEKGAPLVPCVGELTPDMIAKIIAERIAHFHADREIEDRVKFLDNRKKDLTGLALLNTARVPYFCSGCPHNTSTKVPEGSRAFGGVGCHFMANWMDRDVDLFSHMGGEGVAWIGHAPFVKTKHMFQQLGDGTYFHSGSLAIRATVAAGVNITFKILYNDAVAMTGGQPVDGELTVAMITHQMAQEGAKRIVVVSDEPEKYGTAHGFANGTTIHHREELDRVQRELREIEGTTILIYDQTCAAEKRRRRKRGTFPDPAKRAFINDRVCEGCGDCSKQSNCLSVQPIDTEFGRKRAIHQSSCNKDYSCVEGFCPSFVTVHGGEMKKGVAIERSAINIPDPSLPSIDDGKTYGALLTGVGGTGVITIGAMLGMAAHLDGMGVSIVDQMGFAQKGGAVLTHIRFANTPDDINTARLNTASTDVLIGCDMLCAGGEQSLRTLQKGRTRAFINLEKNMSGDFVNNPDLEYPVETLRGRLETVMSQSDIDYIEASQIALELLGDAIGSNLFLVGYAWQKGAIPLSQEAILRAIELNGIKIEWNKQAFNWGRQAAYDIKSLPLHQSEIADGSQSNDANLVERNTAELERYQDRAYAQRYENLISLVDAAEGERAKGMTGLTEAVAKFAYKLMAYKDEYEVARLHTDAAFRAKLESAFEGDYKLKFHLAPPLLSRKDPLTGHPKKIEFGSWILMLFKLLKKLKWLRGTRFDLFGYTEERKMERKLISQYEETLIDLLKGLNHDNHALAVEIASLPDKVRGYGHIKHGNVQDYEIERERLLDRFNFPAESNAAA